MPKIKVGDRVKVRGNTQDYILVDPNRTYTGVVIGKGDGQLLIRLDHPVVRGPGEFAEVSVPETNAALATDDD